MISEATASEYSVAAQIHAVAQAAYMLEAERIGCANFPPLRESICDLQRSADSFLVFQVLGSIVGVLAFDRGTDSVSITRLVVSPTHLRQGIATALIVSLERRLPTVTRFNVSTAQANAPAICLYQRLGYAAESVSTSPDGIPLIHLSKYKADSACSPAPPDHLGGQISA